MNQATEALPCEIEFPEGWEEKQRAAGRMIDGNDERRRYPRWVCRAPAAMRLQQSIPSIPRSEAWVRILLRNVSRCGTGFVHSKQLFPEEECLLLFPNGIQRRLKVMRCRRLGPKCFEVGGEFSDDAGDLPTDQLT